MILLPDFAANAAKCTSVWTDVGNSLKSSFKKQCSWHEVVKKKTKLRRRTEVKQKKAESRQCQRIKRDQVNQKKGKEKKSKHSFCCSIWSGPQVRLRVKFLIQIFAWREIIRPTASAGKIAKRCSTKWHRKNSNSAWNSKTCAKSD